MLRARTANVLQTFFVPLPEDQMQISLNAIDAYCGGIGNEMPLEVSRAGRTVAAIRPDGPWAADLAHPVWASLAGQAFPGSDPRGVCKRAA